MDGLRYLFIDFNAYFAGVEQHDNPAARGRPLIVVPTKSEFTSAIAASYEARPFGIKRGTRVQEARALCPGLIVRAARHDRYVQVHKILKAEVERYLPITKVYSVDEWTCRLSREEGAKPAALEIGRRVQQGILKNVGPSLRSSIGLAPSRLLAKIAAEMHKPDGLTAIGINDLPHFLKDIDLSKIPGIGAGVKARLARAGIDDFMGVWNLQPKQARAIWGSVQGERFWYALHGHETFEDDHPKKAMIGHSRVLLKGHEAPDKALIVARALLMKAASRLRHYGLYAGALSLGVRMRAGAVKGQKWQATRAFSVSQDSYLFLAELEELWAQLREALRLLADGNGGHRLGGVTVYLHRLAEKSDLAIRQTDLFEDHQAAAIEAKRAKLWSLLDGLNADLDEKLAKMGPVGGERPANGRYVTLASQQGLSLDYLGAKIAFSRVPDEAEFLF